MAHTNFCSGIVRRDLIVLMAQEYLPGFITDTFGPQPATERMFSNHVPVLAVNQPPLSLDARPWY